MNKKLNERWQALSGRERMAVALAAWALGLGLLWSLGIAPAWRTLAGAPARQQALDLQLARMEGLAAQVRDIRQDANAGRIPERDAAIGAIQRAARDLGQGSVAATGNQATVRFEQAPPDALARSLDQMRRTARVVPVQAALKQQGGSWRGSVTLAGPGLGD